MSKYKEKLSYTTPENKKNDLFSNWNSNTNIVTVWNTNGRVIYSGNDWEAKALSTLLSDKTCEKIKEIPFEKD